MKKMYKRICFYLIITFTFIYFISKLIKKKPKLLKKKEKKINFKVNFKIKIRIQFIKKVNLEIPQYVLLKVIKFLNEITKF